MRAQPCPIAGCTKDRNGEMCKDHWFRVSQNTRNLVWATYRAWMRDKGAPAKFTAYHAAVRTARQEAGA